MKKIIVTLCLSILFLTKVKCEDSVNSDYKICVKKFYEMLLVKKTVTVKEMESIYLNSSYEKGIRNINLIDYSVLENKESKLLVKLKTYKTVLTQGLSYDSICNLINKSSITNDGYDYSSFLELKLTTKLSCFFEMNTDTPKNIQYVWLPSGEDLGSLMLKYEKIERFLRPGIINDSDGFTNLRMEPNGSSKIIGKFVNNYLFFYTPNSFCNWWAVYKNDNSFEKPLGYIHKNKITQYKDFPIEIKNKVEKIRSDR